MGKLFLTAKDAEKAQRAQSMKGMIFIFANPLRPLRLKKFAHHIILSMSLRDKNNEEKMTKTDNIRLFREIFRGRQDVIPRYWKSAKTGKSGYAPICKNEWRHPECRKGIQNAACSGCEHADYLPLSDLLIFEHFKGKHILGVYPLLSDHTCHFIAADFDDHSAGSSPLHDLLSFYETCGIQDIPCYALRSKSGKGCHAFIFFEKAVPASKARTVVFALLQEANIIGDDVGDDAEISSFDRLFPNQDRLSGKGLGNLIALPFQGLAMQKGHTLFLDPDSGFTAPFPQQWEILADIRKCSESALDRLIKEWRLLLHSAENVKLSDMSKNDDECLVGYPPADFEQIAAQCAFIAHCRDDAETLSEPDWHIMLTISVRCRDGQALSHRLSKDYPQYSYQETQRKIEYALNKNKPYRCETIRKINGKYCRTCRIYGKVKSPIVLGRADRIYLFPVWTELTKEEKELVLRYYDFYRSLDEGRRIPETKAQRHFSAVCRGIRAPLTLHEKAYLKYRYIQNAEKYAGYEYSEVLAQKPKVSESFLYYTESPFNFSNFNKTGCITHVPL
jgi:uncharacterized protein YifE (UPF0438 family)